MNTLFLAAVAVAFPPPPAPHIAASTVGAATVTGAFAALPPGWSLILDDPATTVAPGTLIGLSRADRPRPPFPTGAQLILANGDRFAGKVVGGDDLAVRVSPPDELSGGPWRIPFAQIRVLWVDTPPTNLSADVARYPWLDPDRKKDAILLRNGDVLTGDLERFGDDGQAVWYKPKPGQAAVSIGLAQVSAVAFNPALVAARKPKGTYARLVTRTGTRVSLASAEADAIRLRGTTLLGGKIDLPLADVIALDVMQGKAVYLSDLKPGKETVEGYGELNWPSAADRSVKGDPLRLLTPVGESTFEKGLGTHPKTTIVYPLSGKYHRFEAVVGLDAASGRRGAAVVRVKVDGKEASVAGLPNLTAAGGPVAVVVDVTRAKELTLVVDFGPAGDVQADVNWAGARLIE